MWVASLIEFTAEVSAGDIAATLAFLAALSALFLSNLKRARIELWVDPGVEPVVGSRSWSGGHPTALRLKVKLIAYNSGARGGVLSNVTVGFGNEGGDGLLELTGSSFTARSSQHLKPVGFASGDVDVVTVEGRLRVVEHAPDSAWILNRVRELSPISTVVRYSYARGQGLWQWRGVHEEQRDFPIEASVESLKAEWLRQAEATG